jgi:Na+-transporting NADH:ubiquinone oxidoreductase subunit NqrB
MAAGVPATGVGEAYWNFHVPGVLLVFFLFGVLHKWLAAVFTAYGHRPTMILLYALIMWYAHDPSSEAAVAVLFAIIPLLVLAGLFGALRRGRGARDAAGSALPPPPPLAVSWR